MQSKVITQYCKTSNSINYNKSKYIVTRFKTNDHCTQLCIIIMLLIQVYIQTTHFINVSLLVKINNTDIKACVEDDAGGMITRNFNKNNEENVLRIFCMARK